MNPTKSQVLRCYKRLLRARLEVFKDDSFAIKESHCAIRDAFERNQSLTDRSQILKSIEMAEMAEEILRKDVMQARHLSEDTVRLNVRLDNVKDSKKTRMFEEV